MSDLVQASFYDSLPPAEAKCLQRHEERILTIARNATVAIGQELLAAKDEVGHGSFTRWRRDRMGLGDTTAENYMNAAKAFAPNPELIQDLSQTSVFMLSKPANASVRDAVLDKVASGDVDNMATAIKEAIKAAKEAEALAKVEAEAAKHDAEIAQQKLLDEQEAMERERKAVKQQVEALEEALESVEADLAEATKGDTVEVEVPDPKQAERIAELEAQAAEMKREKEDLEKRNKELGKYAEELEERAKQEALDRLQAEETRKLQMQWRSHANEAAKLLDKVAGLLPTVSELAVFGDQEWAHLEAVEQRLAHVATLIQQQRTQAERFVDSQLAIVDAEAA